MKHVVLTLWQRFCPCCDQKRVSNHEWQNELVFVWYYFKKQIEK